MPTQANASFHTCADGARSTSSCSGNFKADFAGMFAATVLTFLPGLVIYIVGQRYFVEGIEP
jgi:ABC-type glycerol-3-phosphate transport system permease component